MAVAASSTSEFCSLRYERPETILCGSVRLRLWVRLKDTSPDRAWPSLNPSTAPPPAFSRSVNQPVPMGTRVRVRATPGVINITGVTFDDRQLRRHFRPAESSHLRPGSLARFVHRDVRRWKDGWRGQRLKIAPVLCDGIPIELPAAEPPIRLHQSLPMLSLTSNMAETYTFGDHHVSDQSRTELPCPSIHYLGYFGADGARDQKSDWFASENPTGIPNAGDNTGCAAPCEGVCSC